MNISSNINRLNSFIEIIEQLQTRFCEVATNNPKDIETQIAILKSIKALFRVIGVEAEIMGSEE